MSSLKNDLRNAEKYLEYLESMDLPASDRSQTVFAFLKVMEIATYKARLQVQMIPDSIRLYEQYRENNPQVKFEKKDNILKITMPRLITWKKTNAETARKFYESSYMYYFLDYRKNTGYTLPDYYVLWYQHCYKKYFGNFVKDHDNMETKIVTDMISRCFNVDDSPFHCETHVSSKKAEKDCTEIYIVPRETFSEFYKEGVIT